MLAHDLKRLGANARHDPFIVELVHLRIGFFFGHAIERREHQTAHPCLVLRKMQLIRDTPGKDAQKNRSAHLPFLQEIANEQHGGIAADARAVEIEHRYLARSIR